MKITYPQKPIIFNLDDFSEEMMTQELWKNILEFKKLYQNFKVTMFTVPLLCSRSWLETIQKLDWIQMHYHGSDHKDKNEWFNKTEINLPFPDLFYKGFKAPWWRMDQKTANFFISREFVISTSRHSPPIIGPKIYQFDKGLEIIPNVWYENRFTTIHSHVQHQKGNDGLPDILDKLINKFNRNRPFLFISDLYSSGGGVKPLHSEGMFAL